MVKSLSGKVWKVAASTQHDDVMSALIAQRFPQTSLEDVLHPSLQKLSKGVDFPHARQAADRLNFYIEQQQQLPSADALITVFGDYDCDGVCSSALMYLALQELGIKVNIYIPQRDEGYGLTLESARRCLKEYSATKLIVTVDCGIRSAQEVAWLREQGVDTIVTDHHELGETLPDCLVLNHHLEGTPPSAKGLCGAGVAFKLLNALQRIRSEKGQPLFDLRRYLWLVAIATVGDVVPLQNENRVIVFEGLKQLNSKAQRPEPIQELLTQLGRAEVDLNAEDIAFSLAPHLNAAGRIEDPTLAYRLLISPSQEDRTYLAGQLVEQNKRRRDLEDKIITQTHERLKDDAFGFCACPAECTTGIAGIIASRLMDRYHRPVIVGVRQPDGEIKASARAPKPWHILSCLDQCQEELERHGGHEAAAGLTIKSGRFDAFKKLFLKACKEAVNGTMPQPTLALDGTLHASQVTVSLYQKIASLEPFGTGNHFPQWLVNGIYLEQVLPTKNPKHLRLVFRQTSGGYLYAIWFRAQPYQQALEELIGQEVEIATKLQFDNYNPDNLRVKLQLIDLRPKA